MPGELLAEMLFPGERKFQVVNYDLLDEPTDAIVNAANGALAHGGGVAAAIARAAGPEFDEEGRRLVRERGRIPVGEAVVTGAGSLRFQGVIHAVGPSLGDGDEEDKLTRALKAAFLRAHERGWKSVSFPAVSSGIFAVPLPVCARAYVRAVTEFFASQPRTSLQLIRLVLLRGPLVEWVQKEVVAAGGRRCGS